MTKTTGKAIEERTWIVGPLRVVGPTKSTRIDGRGAKWTVMAVDTVVEDVAEKVFDSAVKAQAFIDELVGGAAPVDPMSEAAPELSEGVKKRGPASVRPTVTTATPATLNRSHTRYPAGVSSGPKDPDAAPFNLMSVADALTQEGLDPFVEVAKVLKERAPVMRDGKQAVDPETGELLTYAVIGPVDRAKILVELGQYVQPKLKAVEVKVEDRTQLTEEQLNARIAKIMAASAGAT